MKIFVRLLTVAALLSVAVPVLAHDFSAVVPGGQTLYFNVVNGAAVVTYPADVTAPVMGWNGYQRPSGALTIPSTVSNGTATYNVVAVDRYAFYGCNALTSLTVSEGVTAIRGRAFYDCTAITNVILPSTLDSIGTYAFHNCSSLSEVTALGIAPPATYATAFDNIDLSACTLHVSCQAVANYAAVEPWSQFGTIADAGCTATLAVSANDASRGSVSGGGTYSVGTSVVLTATPAAGCFFACWNDGDTLNPRVVTLNSDLQFKAFFFACIHDTVSGVGVQHDTVYVTTILRDTVFVTIHDTVTVHDGGQPTFCNLQVVSGDPALGIAAGSCIVPAGTVIEICALPFEGFSFSRWLDGSTDNPRRVQVSSDRTYTALFATGQSGASAAGALRWSAAASGLTITVSGAATRQVRILDMQGRLMAETAAASDRACFVMPQPGAYLVQVGSGPARKIIVTE